MMETKTFKSFLYKRGCSVNSKYMVQLYGLFFFSSSPTVNLILVSHTFQKNTKSRCKKRRRKKFFLFKNVKENVTELKPITYWILVCRVYGCMVVLIVLLFWNVISITINYDRHFARFLSTISTSHIINDFTRCVLCNLHYIHTKLQ